MAVKKPDFTQPQKDAFAQMKSLLTEYGLGSLANRLKDLILEGVSNEALLASLQESPEWKKRFAGNELLRNSGLPVLSVAEYLNVERSYSQVMKNYGLPTGFYDDPDDFAKFIGNSVSAAELESRVGAYSDLANRDDPAVRQQLAAMGMSNGDLLAFMMDPQRANPLIQKRYKSTLIGAAARRTGLVADQAYLERLAGMGITEQQAQQGYGLIAENLATVENLGDIYGEDYNQGTFESEVFEGSGEALNKRKRLASQERAAFGGSSGISGGSLGRDSTGSY